MLLIPVVAGVGIGVLSGLLGIGGGTIMVPVFRLAFGLEAVVSTATSLFTIIPTSISGAISHVRNKTCVLKLGIATGIGGACTSPIGVYLSSVSPAWAIMAVAAIVIAYSAITMFRKAIKIARAKKATEGDAAGSAVAATGGDEAASIERRHVGIAVLVGLLAGLASGYVGVGGGFLIVPLLTTFAGVSMRQASGTSLLAVMILAIPGTIEQGLLGHIDFVAGLAIAVGSIPGAVVGAKLINKVPELALRILFGCVLLVAAVLLVVNELGILS